MGEDGDGLERRSSISLLAATGGRSKDKVEKLSGE